jgi:DNA-binding GntR family transcriptional regulator
VAETGDLRLERRTMSGDVAAALRGRILDGTFAEGSNLRQDALALQLGVSRIPLREAFQQLAAEGLVTLVPHRGAVVSSLSLEDIEELFDLRALIEPDLLERAVPRMTSVDLAKAESALNAYDDSFDAADIVSWGDINRRFHMALHAPAGRRRSLALVESLLANTDRYTRLQLALTDGIARAQREHRILLELCRAGRTSAAGELLRAHIQHAAADLLAFLGTHRPAPPADLPDPAKS